MVNISIRNLKDETYEALKQKALLHGLSMEEEVRQLLDRTCLEKESIAATFRRYFGPENGVDLDEVLAEIRKEQSKTHEPMSFDE